MRVVDLTAPGGTPLKTSYFAAARQYPPTVEAMDCFAAARPARAGNLIHYSRSQDAPWLWYEPLHAERALTLLDRHALPASSWSDSEPYRGEIRRGAQKVLEKAAGPESDG